MRSQRRTCPPKANSSQLLTRPLSQWVVVKKGWKIFLEVKRNLSKAVYQSIDRFSVFLIAYVHGCTCRPKIRLFGYKRHFYCRDIKSL